LQRLELVIEREDPVVTCPAYPWRHPEDNLDDDKFNFFGVATLFEMQEANGVNEVMREILPLGKQQQLFAAKQNIDLQIMLRRRYSWDIACEKEKSTSSKKFFEALYGIRHYFYDIEQILAFLESGEEHTEGFHYDHHSEKFHVHMDLAPVESQLVVIELCLAATLTLNVVVCMFFQMKTICMKERNFRRSVRTRMLISTLKFFLIYVPCVFFISSCQVIIAIYCFHIN